MDTWIHFQPSPPCQNCLVPSLWASDPTFNTTCLGIFFGRMAELRCENTKHGDTCIASCNTGYTGDPKVL